MFPYMPVALYLTINSTVKRRNVALLARPISKFHLSTQGHCDNLIDFPEASVFLSCFGSRGRCVLAEGYVSSDCAQCQWSYRFYTMARRRFLKLRTKYDEKVDDGFSSFVRNGVRKMTVVQQT
jgi:hypothetical protein